MSLATRCTACGTVFRVVQDQLRVSEGWVRCGRCDEVFNALDGLFDLEQEAALAASRSPSSQQVLAELAQHRHVPAEEAAISATYAAPRATPGAAPASTPYDPLPAEDPASAASADAAEPTALPASDVDAPSSAAPAADEPALSGIPPAGDDEEGAAATPAFIRHADQRARWQRPAARIGLAAATGVLAVALVLQVVHHQRDSVAARWPALRPALDAWCAVAGCRIQPPRRIDDLSVENSTLTRGPAGGDSFKLSVTLRNRGPMGVAMPSIDLSLTDANGAVVARRALSPADYRAPRPAIAAGSRRRFSSSSAPARRASPATPSRSFTLESPRAGGTRRRPAPTIVTTDLECPCPPSSADPSRSTPSPSSPAASRSRSWRTRSTS